jgi:hypothetical protein
MSALKVAEFAVSSNEIPQIHVHAPKPRHGTAKQIAASLGLRKEHVEQFLASQGVPSVTLAKQRTYVLDDVDEAIRRVGGLTAPKVRVKKAKPVAKMTADEIAVANGFRLVTRGAK